MSTRKAGSSKKEEGSQKPEARSQKPVTVPGSMLLKAVTECKPAAKAKAVKTMQILADVLIDNGILGVKVVSTDLESFTTRTVCPNPAGQGDAFKAVVSYAMLHDYLQAVVSAETVITLTYGETVDTLTDDKGKPYQKPVRVLSISAADGGKVFNTSRMYCDKVEDFPQVQTAAKVGVLLTFDWMRISIWTGRRWPRGLGSRCRRRPCRTGRHGFRRTWRSWQRRSRGQ